MANVLKTDPAPVVQRLIAADGLLNSDWYRYFQRQDKIIAALQAASSGTTGGGGGGNTISVLDGGRPDTDFTGGSTFDMGGV